MKYLFILSCFLLSLNSFTQDFWQQRDSVNGPSKAVCGSFVIMGKGFVLGGLDDFGFKRKMYSYNPFQDDWDDELSIGGENGDGLERGSATTFSIGTKGYVCLGQGPTDPYKKDLWEYNLETGAWSQKANFIGSARKQAISFVINDIAYVGTGQDASGLKKDMFKYDPLTNSWTQLNDFAGTARRQAVGLSMGSFGFIGTGDDGILKKDFWMYVVSTDSWIQKTDFPGTARAGATGWSTFPTCFIATGEDVNFSYTKDVWEYNYYGNSWVQRADFPGPGRKNAISFVVNGIAFLGTGFSGVFEDDFYAYFGIVGLKEQNLQFQSIIYPNPVRQIATIQFESTTQNELSFRLFTITGREVTEQIEMEIHSNEAIINVSQLTSGNYFYQLMDSNSGSVSTGKMIIVQ